MCFSFHEAGAVPYSAVSALSLGAPLGSGGLSSANSGTATGGATAWAGGTTSSNVAAISTQNATSNVTIQGNVAIGGQGDASFLQGPNNAPTDNLTVTGASDYASGASFQSTPGKSYNPTGGLNQPVTLSGAATAVTSAVSTIKGLTADYTNPTGTVSVGRTGYNSIVETGALTTTLTLNASRASDYFFVYLEGGIGSGGSIAVSGSTSIANVIVVLGAASTITATTDGTYLVSGAGNVTVNSGGAINGGIFLAGTSTTAEELFLTGGTQITSNPWNGYILASAPEPASLAALASGLVGLVLVRRRKGNARRS